MTATIAGTVAGKIKFGLMPVSGALGRAGDGGEQDRAEHKANDADHGKDKTLPVRQALAFGRMMRAKRPRLIGREIDQHTRGAAAGSPPPPFLMRRTAW